jgi:hypothetical protein
VHTDSFQVKTDAGTTSYRPGEYLSIHVTSHDYDLKYRGILLHAVDENGVSVGEMRFPRSEKLPKHHSPVECPHAALHTDAELKPFRSVFRFKAPEAGTGKLTFRCLVKTGPANTGDFWYERASVRASEASERSERACEQRVARIVRNRSGLNRSRACEKRAAKIARGRIARNRSGLNRTRA